MGAVGGVLSARQAVGPRPPTGPTGRGPARRSGRGVAALSDRRGWGGADSLPPETARSSRRAVRGRSDYVGLLDDRAGRISVPGGDALAPSRTSRTAVEFRKVARSPSSGTFAAISPTMAAACAKAPRAD